MPIDINGISSHSSTNNRTKATESHRASGPEPVGTENGTSTTESTNDQVSLSGEAKALQQLEERIKNLSVSDQDKVNHFRNAIDNGTYQPNPESIATKMLDADNLF